MSLVSKSFSVFVEQAAQAKSRLHSMLKLSSMLVAKLKTISNLTVLFYLLFKHMGWVKAFKLHKYLLSIMVYAHEPKTFFLLTTPLTVKPLWR